MTTFFDFANGSAKVADYNSTAPTIDLVGRPRRPATDPASGIWGQVRDNIAAVVEAGGTYDNRSWALSNSEHCLVGGPERSWVTWSGGVAREAVTVFRHGRGCRWAWRDPPSLSRVRYEGAPGVALTA